MNELTLKWAYNPQAQDLTKVQAQSCWRKNSGRSCDFINKRFLGGYVKTWELWSNDRCFCWLAESMDLSELGSRTSEILQSLWGCPSVRIRDSLSAYDVMIQVRDGLAPIPETSIMNYRMLMENQSDLPIVKWRRSLKPCLSLRMVR